MQTFLPYENFNKTAQVLDKRRLFKQVVESRQILGILGIKMLKVNGEPFKFSKKGFFNHPAVKMWKEGVNYLIDYHNCLLKECIIRKINTKIESISHSLEISAKPWFLGEEKFHNVHKANLLRKDYNYYIKFFPNIVPLDCYIWRKEDL